MKNFFVLMIFAVFGSCAPQAPTKPSPVNDTDFINKIVYGPNYCADCFQEIEVLAEPGVARIETNEQYEGTTPLKIKVAVDKQGVLKDTYLLVRAIPTGVGYVQQKLLVGGNKVPTRMMFDMRLVPVNRNIDVNVNTTGRN